MSLGSRYFRARWLGLALPLIAGAGILGTRALGGTGKVHLYLAPKSQAVVTLDGSPFEVADTRWHRVVEMPRGKHRLSVTVQGHVTEHEVDVSLFKEYLVPIHTQCFVWIVRGQVSAAARVVGRYDDSKPIEVPAGMNLGAEELNEATVEPPAIFVGMPCDALNGTDEEVLNAM